MKIDIDWVQTVVSILTGLAVCIPVVVELVKQVQKAIREKNWTALMKLVMELMARAEELYQKGSDKKKWVMEMLAASENTINCDIDYAAVSDMIDSMCDMSKVVNGKKAGGQ